MKNDKTQLKTNEIYNEVIKRLTTAGYKDNWVHGIAHINRVRKNLKLLLAQCKIPNNIKIRKSDPALKEKSVLENLIYNYLATFEIVSAVKEFLNKKFLKTVEIKNKETLDEINYLILLTKENKTHK